MDINTVLTALKIAEPLMTATKFTAFRKQLRTQYLNEEIAVREKFLAQKVRNAAMSLQFEQDIAKFRQQLSAL